MKKLHVLMLVVILGVVLLPTLVSPVATAAAGPVEPEGTNGQQITVTIRNAPAGMSYVKVRGPNQHGYTATWQAWYNPAVQKASTTGWWWKGWVTIWVKVNGTTRSCNIEIPKFFVGSYYNVNFYWDYASCSH